VAGRRRRRKKKSYPTLIRGTIEGLLDRLDLRDRVLEGQACKAWSEVVGGSVARRSAAERFADGTLFVVVESPAWHAELGFIRGEILGKLEEILGKRIVTNLRFRIGVLPDPPVKEKVEAGVAEHRNLPLDQRQAVESQVQNVRDPELQEVVRQALLARARAEET